MARPDVWKTAFNHLQYELTRLTCNIPIDDPRHDKECARCLAVNIGHDIKWETKNRKKRKQ